ncbi:unnamed protein product [Owenia fusiformis]|uniref:Uncharacterized protein n=1 Tax=Owenia fusiformis TaxID=6347 RepID=A0A8J1UAY0_OWEFU|nr:unnamed protein product [Owenia fusiformis]
METSIFRLIFLFFFGFYVKIITCNQWTTGMFATPKINVKLIDQPIDIILDIITWNHCLLMCAVATTCKGFNYNVESPRCELFETVNCTQLESSAGWRFGQIKTDNLKMMNNQNIAVNRPTYQSTTYEYFQLSKSGNAVDGNTDGDYMKGSCTATAEDTNVKPWWVIDLGKSYTLLQIVVWNRMDDVSYRLHDFAIEVDCEFDGSNTDSPSWSRTYLYTGTPESNPTTISLPQPSVGRFVKVQNAVISKSEDSNDDLLTLCEVEVYVESADEDCECELGKF